MLFERQRAAEDKFLRKKVHGGMKLRIHEDEDKDEQVSKYSQHMNDEEKNKQKDLSLCIL